eukprot:scaffold6609_cov34-Tisochrysis_lutea.AAC.3
MSAELVSGKAVTPSLRRCGEPQMVGLLCEPSANGPPLWTSPRVGEAGGKATQKLRGWSGARLGSPIELPARPPGELLGDVGEGTVGTAAATSGPILSWFVRLDGGFSIARRARSIRRCAAVTASSACTEAASPHRVERAVATADLTSANTLLAATMWPPLACAAAWCIASDTTTQSLSRSMMMAALEESNEHGRISEIPCHVQGAGRCVGAGPVYRLGQLARELATVSANEASLNRSRSPQGAGECTSVAAENAQALLRDR